MGRCGGYAKTASYGISKTLFRAYPYLLLGAIQQLTAFTTTVERDSTLADTF